MSILRALSPVGRGVLVATLAVSVLSVAMEWLLHVEGTPVFLVSALGILGLAYVVGAATERLGALAGPQVGGILNATFGNVAELIIAFFALAAGELEVVKASLTGSIVGNLLLVLGFSLFLGGLRNGQQRFSPKVAGLDATLLVLAVIGLFVPAVFALSTGGSAGAEPRTLENVSVALAVLSEQLVGAIDPFIASFDLTPFFVGVILIPTIGNLAEHLVAVQLAIRDRVDFAMAVAIGSSLQVALFVAPVLVLLGLVVGQPMDLVFTPLEIAAVAAAAGITALIAFDGESNWLEGALLLGVYAILAVSFFYLEG